jgi:hypothetical protein
MSNKFNRYRARFSHVLQRHNDVACTCNPRMCTLATIARSMQPDPDSPAPRGMKDAHAFVSQQPPTSCQPDARVKPLLRASIKSCTAQDTTQVMHAECVRMNPDIQSTWPQHKVQTHSISRYEHSGRPPTDGLHAVPYSRPRVAAAAARATPVSAAAVSWAKPLRSPRSARAQHRALTQIPAPRSAARTATVLPDQLPHHQLLISPDALQRGLRHVTRRAQAPCQGSDARQPRQQPRPRPCAKRAERTTQRVRHAWPTQRRPPAAVTASRAACWRPRRRRRRGRGPVPS